MPPDGSPRVAQLALVPSPYCRGCPARGICREQRTELGCQPSGPPHPALLHPENPDWLVRYGEVNGFELHYDALPQDLPELPSYIPAVRPNPWAGGLPSVEALAIPLAYVERLARQVRKHGVSAKRLLGLGEHQPLIVLGFASDDFLERNWCDPDRTRLLMAIKAVEPDAAIAWNYSVWHRHARGWTYPRVEHLYNQKRSLQIYAQLQDMGIAAIPHIYWGIQDDLSRWSEWLSDNSSIRTVAIDLQTVDSETAWRASINALRCFRALLPTGIHILFSGVCRKERVVELRRVWPESSLCNHGPWFASAIRYKRAYGLARPWAMRPDQWSKPAIFQDVVRQYATLGQIADRPAPSCELACISSVPSAGITSPRITVFPPARWQGGSRQLSFGDIPHVASGSIA